MKEKFKTFFIYLFPLWIVFFMLHFHLHEDAVTFRVNLFLSLFCAAMLAFVFTYMKYGIPKEMENIFKRKTYQTLMQKGFVRNDFTLAGKVKNYTTIVGYAIQNVRSRPGLQVTVLFDPFSSGHLLSDEEFKSLLKHNNKEIIFGKQNEWTIDSISSVVLFGLIHEPSSEKVLAKAELLVDVLISNHLKPITAGRLNEITPQIQQHYISSNQ